MIDFTQLGQYRENNRIEAKKALGGFPESVWETYSAFANTFGGIILLGVVEEKDRSLHAVNLPDPRQYIDEFWRVIGDKNRVSANILSAGDVSVQDVDGKNIIVITVPRASRQDKPVFIGGSPFGGTYRRSGDGDYRCSYSEVENMLRDAKITTPDTFLTDLPLSALNEATIRRYRGDVLERRICGALTNAYGTDFLVRIGAARALGERIFPTNAGLITFGKNAEIKRIFPKYILKVQTADGRKIICSEKDNRSGNAYDFYCLAQQLLGEYAAAVAYDNQKIIKGALLEALLNSIINADYYGGGVTITVGERQIDFTNAGSFRILPKDAADGGVSDPRNAALSRIFSYAGTGSRSGRGIPSIFAAWNKCGYSAPVIKESFAPDAITFSFPFSSDEKSDSTVSKTGRIVSLALKKAAIIDYLTDNASADAETLRLSLRLDDKDTRLLLDGLLSENVVEVFLSGGKICYRLKY